MESCIFCEIQHGLNPVIGGPVIYEDDLVYAHHDQFGKEPFYLGNLLLETKRHAPGFADLTPTEAQAIGLQITRLSQTLKACTGAEKVYVYFYGELTPHLHVYLTARYPGTPEEYWRWNIDDWAGAPRGGTKEITALCERLSAHLANSSS